MQKRVNFSRFHDDFFEGNEDLMQNIRCSTCGSANVVKTADFRKEHTCLACGWCFWTAAEGSSPSLRVRDLHKWCKANERDPESLTEVERNKFIGPKTK